MRMDHTNAEPPGIARPRRSRLRETAPSPKTVLPPAVPGPRVREAASGLPRRAPPIVPRMTTTLEQETRDAAKEAGLRYYDDSRPGWSRVRTNGRFRYLDSDGRAITDPDALERIENLVIPPAWERVWICPHPSGHLQATGRDARGRKQYRYHEKFRAMRDQTKYGRLADFGAALPKVRERVEHDLKGRCSSREKALAVCLRLLDRTHIRIGNDAYARDNGHYGLTTLRRKHLDINGAQVRLSFVGKSGKEREIGIQDLKLAKAMEKCSDLPGYELFKYLDEGGETRRVDSAEVNDYIRELTGDDFTAKDFRTWGGTVIAAVVLCSLEDPTDDRECQQNLVTAVKTTAAELGNTPATCRKYYIHPVIFEAYQDHSLRPAMETAMRAIRNPEAHHLEPEEAAVLAILQGAPRP